MGETVDKIRKLTEDMKRLEKAQADMKSAETKARDARTAAEMLLNDLRKEWKEFPNVFWDDHPEHIHHAIDGIQALARRLKARAFEDEHPWAKEILPENREIQ